MIKSLSLLLVTLAAVPLAVLAQGPKSVSAQPSLSTDPIAASQNRMYTMLISTVIAAAEKMPEESYSFRPTPDVRSFGQLVGHLADSQYYFCSSAAGETTPSGDVEKTKTGKVDLVAALKESVAYCRKTYGGMTDVKGSATMKLMNLDFAKLTVLSANTAHDYEHYGNMVTYMRLKGIVPPTSEKGSSAESKPDKK